MRVELGDLRVQLGFLPSTAPPPRGGGSASIWFCPFTEAVSGRMQLTPAEGPAPVVKLVPLAAPLVDRPAPPPSPPQLLLLLHGPASRRAGGTDAARGRPRGGGTRSRGAGNFRTTTSREMTAGDLLRPVLLGPHPSKHAPASPAALLRAPPASAGAATWKGSGPSDAAEEPPPNVAVLGAANASDET